MWDLSSPTRNPTPVPCIGMQIVNHWVTREVPILLNLNINGVIQYILYLCVTSFIQHCQEDSSILCVSIVCYFSFQCSIPVHEFIYLFYFWLHWVFVAAWGLSLVVASRDYSSLRCAGFSLQSLLLLRSMGSRCAGFSSCGMWA